MLCDDDWAIDAGDEWPHAVEKALHMSERCLRQLGHGLTMVHWHQQTIASDEATECR